MERFSADSRLLRYLWLKFLKVRIKKGAEVRRRGVKFNTSARGFVIVHTSPVHRSSSSMEKHLFIF
jgi:hypothetical protein